MSGYYCRGCSAIKPLFASTESSDLGIACLGTVPFDPELGRHCDLGMPLDESNETPVGRALDQIAQRLLDSLEAASAHASRELRRPSKEPPR
jgi:MinD-like ATPase involved in chromosome partitioning or flagellar assembly